MGYSIWQINQFRSCSIHSHFLQDLQPFWIVHLVVAVNGVLCILAIVGNLLILVALKDALLHPPSKLLLRCLATTDLFVGLISQPSFMVSIISEAVENLSVCQVSECLLHISGATLCGISLCTLTMICVDRLLAMVLGVRYRHVVTLARVRGIVVFSWVLLSSISVLYFLRNEVFVIVLCVVVLVCIVTCTLCYSKIYFTLRYRQAQVSQQPGHSIPTRARVLKYKRSVSNSMWVYLALIVCYHHHHLL